LDVIEVGVFTHKRGEVIPVKVVGCLGLLDEGETDWKIIAINVNDPHAHEINGPADLDIHKPGLIEGIRDFFINYKVPDGKPKNVLAFDGAILDRVLLPFMTSDVQDFTLKVIAETNEQYKTLLANPSLSDKHGYAMDRLKE
jgi:inorganic pyrophosphatase